MSHNFGPGYEKGLSEKMKAWPPKTQPQFYWRSVCCGAPVNEVFLDDSSPPEPHCSKCDNPCGVEKE